MRKLERAFDSWRYNDSKWLDIRRDRKPEGSYGNISGARTTPYQQTLVTESNNALHKDE